MPKDMRAKDDDGSDDMLRIVSKILEPQLDIGDKIAATPFDSRNRVIRTKKGLSTPNKSPT